MPSRKAKLEQQVKQKLQAYKASGSLPGLTSDARSTSLANQLVDSIRRVDFVMTIDRAKLSADRPNPGSDAFDPIRGAIVLQCQGNLDEAAWLVFLATHFGKHRKLGWQFTKDIYGRLNQGGTWDWESTSTDPSCFRDWLRLHQARFSKHRFGNHRKYQSNNADKPSGTGAAVDSYIRWVKDHGGHETLFSDAIRSAAGNLNNAFNRLYYSMKAVKSFGRMGRFDYLTMIGKTGIAEISPGSAYLDGATGPVRGGKLLFGGSTTAPLTSKGLDAQMIALGNALGVGMQVIEDALCNWQKSPDLYIGFRG